MLTLSMPVPIRTFAPSGESAYSLPVFLGPHD
jgi:hypothetical protein